jgi:hypothetical protein
MILPPSAHTITSPTTHPPTHHHQHTPTHTPTNTPTQTTHNLHTTPAHAVLSSEFLNGPFTPTAGCNKQTYAIQYFQ